MVSVAVPVADGRTDLASVSVPGRAVDPSATHRAKQAHWHRRRRRLMAYGLWEPFADIKPVRAHVRELRHRWRLSLEAIAAMSGLPPSTVAPVAYPKHGSRRQQITTTTARALLAVEFDLDAIPAHLFIDATGTRRRLQGLAVMGHPLQELGGRLGVAKQRVYQWRMQDRITVENARRVRDLYDDLWDVDGGCTKTRRHAERQQWMSPLAWDDDTIDDPKARPRISARRVSEPDSAAVARILAGDLVPLRPSEREIVVRKLHAQGLSDTAIAVRAGTTAKTVQRIRDRLELPALVDPIDVNGRTAADRGRIA